MPAPKQTAAPSGSIDRRFAALTPDRGSIGLSGLQFLGGIMTSDNSLFDLSGRIAVVTGGNGGIGRAMALGLARAGASVAVLARNEQKNQLVHAELKKIGRPALVSRLDVTDRAALATAVAEVERALGGIDILVNNAGIVALTGGVLNETADIWDT